MATFWQRPNHLSTHIIILLFSITYIISAQNLTLNSSGVAVVCRDMTNGFFISQVYDIDESEALTDELITPVTIPIAQASSDGDGLVCYLYVLISDDGPSAFDEDSECTFSIELQEQTQAPTPQPTAATDNPTSDPTINPTIDPTLDPTADPTKDPTIDPTKDPTNDPTLDPTVTFDPTNDPTSDPTLDPTATFDPTNDPTKDPTLDPTNDPTTDPTFDPTNDPTTDPTFDPTADPTVDPTTDPTTDPTHDPTHDPTKDPTTEPPTPAPTGVPTTTPTTGMPTPESERIDVDEITMLNIFNVNGDNILWVNGLDGNLTNPKRTSLNNNYTFWISPECGDGNNDTLGSANIDRTIGNDTLYSLYDPYRVAGYLNTLRFPNESDLTSTRELYPVLTSQTNTALFPTQFTVTTHDTEDESSITFAVMNGSSTSDITCSYDQAFETTDDVNTTRGIEYIFLPLANTGSIPFNDGDDRAELYLDVIITRSCVEDTTTTTDFPFTTIFTSEEVDDDDDDTLLGLQLEVVIAMAVVLAVIILAVIITVICLVRRRSMFEDVANDDEILKGPKEHTELATAHTPFTVTERDHAEMLELQARNSLSTGLEAD